MREIKNEYLHMSKNEYLHENNQNLNKNGSMATMAEKMAASLEELRKQSGCFTDTTAVMPFLTSAPLKFASLSFNIPSSLASLSSIFSVTANNPEKPTIAFNGVRIS